MDTAAPDRATDRAPDRNTARAADGAADRVVDRLLGEGLLDPRHAERSRVVVAEALGAPAPAASGLPRLVEVVAYLGGALVLAAGSLFVVQEWGSLAFGTQVTLLAVVALVLGAAGAVVARAGSARASDSRRRLAGSLLTGCALAVAFLVGLVLDHLAARTDWPDHYWPAVAGAAAGAVVAAVGYRLARTALGLVAVLAGVLTAVGNVVDDGTQAGLAFLAVGLVWLVLTERGVLAERQVARALGVATALLGAQLPALDGDQRGLGYALTAAVAVAGTAAYLRLHGWPYLAVAVLAVTLVVPEAVADWTDGSLGAVGGVLLTGVTLLAASAIGYRLRSGQVEPHTP